MDIGTDKVSKQIRKYIPHYLIDIINPDKDFSLFDFINYSKKIIDFCQKKSKNLIFVGGTVLYILALIEGYNLLPTNPQIRQKYEKLNINDLKEMLTRLDKKLNTNFATTYKDKRRIIRILEAYELSHQNPLLIWQKQQKFPIDKVFTLTNNRNKIYENINSRVDRQINQGLIDEVKFILKKYPNSPNFKSIKTFGYKEIVDYLQGKINLEEAIRLIKRNTRRFAKRQLSFLKKINSDVINLSDFNDDLNLACNYICQKLGF